MCGEAKQSGSKKGKEGRTKGGSRGSFEGVVAQRILYLLFSLPYPPFL